MRFNLKHFLDYATHANPGAVARAVIQTAQNTGLKRRAGMRGLGADAGASADYSGLMSYLTDPNLYSLDVVTPASGGASFNSNGTATLSAPVVVNNATGQPSAGTPWYTSLLNSITAAAPNLLTAYTANQQLSACSQTNQARLSQGLAPVDCSSFAPTAQVGLTSGTSSLLLLLGGGALLLMFMGRRKS
jgi:hypothetical protein